jgi:hypothetical protein
MLWDSGHDPYSKAQLIDIETTTVHSSVQEKTKHKEQPACDVDRTSANHAFGPELPRQLSHAVGADFATPGGDPPAMFTGAVPGILPAFPSFPGRH